MRREPSELMRRLTRSMLEEIRGRWDSRQEVLSRYALESFYSASQLVSPLVPGPDLRATWDAASPTRELLDADDDDILTQTLRDRVGRWLEMATLIEQNEPRFLRQVGFPTDALSAVEKYMTLARNDLASDWVVLEVDEHENVASDYRDLEGHLGLVAKLFPALHERLDELAQSVATKAEGYEEAAERMREEAIERLAELADAADFNSADEPGVDPSFDTDVFDLSKVMSDL